MDSSVRFHTGNLSSIYDFFNCRNDRIAAETTGASRILHRPMQKRKCDKFPYLLHSAAGHGIFSTTHSGKFFYFLCRIYCKLTFFILDLYEFFSTNLTQLKKTTCNMFEAGFAFVIRTRDVVRHILKW